MGRQIAGFVKDFEQLSFVTIKVRTLDVSKRFFWVLNDCQDQAKGTRKSHGYLSKV